MNRPLHHSYYIKNSMNWIIKRLNTKWIRFIDPNKDKFVYTITTKQWRLPNAGFIKIEYDTIDREYAKYLLANDCMMITDDIHKPFFARILTPLECYLLMGFTREDVFRIEQSLGSCEQYWDVEIVE